TSAGPGHARPRPTHAKKLTTQFDDSDSELHTHLKLEAGALVVADEGVSRLAVGRLAADPQVLGHFPHQVGAVRLVADRLAGSEVVVERVVDAVAPVRVQLVGTEVVVQLDPAARSTDALEGHEVDVLQDAGGVRFKRLADEALGLDAETWGDGPAHVGPN